MAVMAHVTTPRPVTVNVFAISVGLLPRAPPSAQVASQPLADSMEYALTTTHVFATVISVD